MTDLVPVSGEPMSLAAVDDVCTRLETWADQTADVDALNEARSKLAAVDAYIARTSKEGRGRVAATDRRLETRIGKLLGPAKLDHDRSPGATSSANDLGLTPNERHAFRQMAEHEDIVETEVAKSTDERPTSRRTILNAIKKARADERAKLDEEIDRRNLTRGTPETRAPYREATAALGAARGAIESVQHAARNLTPAEWVAKYRKVGPFEAKYLPLDEMEAAGYWLVETAKEIRR